MIAAHPPDANRIMRIGLIIYGSLDTLSGGYLYDRELVAALRGCGDEVLIFSLPWRSYSRHLIDNFSQDLARRTKAAGLDLLLQDELNHPSLAFQNQRLRQALGVPLISIVHHLRISEDHPPSIMPLYRQIEQNYVNSVDGFIFNSRTTQATVERLLNRPRPGIVAFPAADHIAPPAARTVEALVEQRADAAVPLRILAVGNVTPRKNIHTLLRALGRLPADSWQLTVAGSLQVDPSYVARLRALCEEMGIGAGVRFRGAMDTAALRQLYAAHHVMALPSYEGFGIVYLEAMSFGTVPIAATTGAAHEIIDDGRNGFLVNPNDPAALAARLDRFIRSRASWREFALAARARYDKHPTWHESMIGASQWLHEITQTRVESHAPH